MLRAFRRAAREVLAAARSALPPAGGAGRAGASPFQGLAHDAAGGARFAWTQGTPRHGLAALPSTEHARGLRTRSTRSRAAARGAPAEPAARNPLKHSCRYWDGTPGSCRAGDACRHKDWHMPGVPSPARACPFWTGAAGSCPHDLACHRLASHVPGKPSPSLLPRLDAVAASAPAGAAGGEAAGALAAGGEGLQEQDAAGAPDVEQITREMVEGYRDMFAKPPRGTPAPYAGVTDPGDAWDPVAPSAQLVAPGAPAVRARLRAAPMQRAHDLAKLCVGV